ncbi:MAG: hypothetical protein ACRENQ_16080 [Gemmatimonadaceae bacterium]
MRPVLAVAGAAAVLVLVGFAAPVPNSPPPKTATVKVHCPIGKIAGFVTPVRLRIAVGDSVEWQMTGRVVSDSLIIALKDTAQVWPFADARRPRGAAIARARRAERKGTYSYSVTLDCRMAGGVVQHVVIDPDIIIE